MKENISSERAVAEFGIELLHERMENGELRFHLFGKEGNGYVRTEAAPNGAWQNSHFHTEFRELYLVEFGWMALAVPGQDREPAITIYRPGETCFTPVGQVHNVYLSSNSIIHTIKYGIRGAYKRWEPEPWFNEITHKLSEAEILQLADAN